MEHQVIRSNLSYWIQSSSILCPWGIKTIRIECWTPFLWKRLNAQIWAIEFAVNHCWQKDKDYKKKQEIKEGEEEDVYGSKKKHIEEKFVAEKSLMH